MVHPWLTLIVCSLGHNYLERMLFVDFSVNRRKACAPDNCVIDFSDDYMRHGTYFK